MSEQMAADELWSGTQPDSEMKQLVDRRLVGIVAIAFIVSSAGFSVFVGERVEEPIEVIRNEWNTPTDSRGIYNLPKIEGRYTYSLGLVIRKPFEKLELFFATLKNSSFTLAGEEMPPSALPRERFGAIAELGDVASTIEDYAAPYLMRLEEQEFRVRVGAEEYGGFIVDLTGPILPVAPSAAQHGLPTVHAVLFDPNGTVVQYYRGFPDFFLARNESIIDLTIQRNQNVTKFSQRTTQQGTSLLMKDAPALGRLEFKDLRKEDQIFVTVAVNPADPDAMYQTVPTRDALIHMVLVFIDGECYHVFASPMIW